MSRPRDKTGVSTAEGDTIVEQTIGAISGDTFNQWYHDRQFAQNILEGKDYFNGPSPPKDADRHSPSNLLQCHRKASYSRQNAPREGTVPEGLFWFGSAFEEEVIVPFLQETVTIEDTYVANSLWVDTEVDATDPPVQIRGSTDPAIVTGDAEPLFLTEVKTTTSLDSLNEPKPHHRAQLHAYLYALDDEYDHSVTDGMLIYGSRKTLEIQPFHVTFDEDFWESVVEWMATQTEYEQAGDLPPATPERDWECSYCSFKHRCGEADTPYSNIGHDGLLPLFDSYDQQALDDYLQAHTEENAKLTPTLAHEYSGLVGEFGVYDWGCPSCGEAYVWDDIDWDGDVSSPPFCPRCLVDDRMVH
jgi:CRISPR/Cas system-associated exonuclease Cas4 (RecB family)